MSSQLFVPSMLLGGGVLALWAYVRLPRARPRSLKGTVGHLVLAFVLFTLAPALVHAGMVALPRPLSVVVVVGAVTAPVLSYALLSWVWLLAYILKAGTSGPRGGHPVTAPGR
jgi:hypothetical protein